MDIYRFINSRDIRNYLKDLGYEFNALEAAWLVHQCQNRSLEEKNRAWSWIISNKPDMEVCERINCSYRASLHDTLREYMKMNDDLLKIFASEDEGVYTCRFYGGGRDICLCSSDRAVYFDRNDCIRKVEEFLKEYDEGNKNGIYATIIRHFKDSDTKIEVRYDRDCRVMSVNAYNSICDKYNELSFRFFDGLWFDFPTPFKKGDIVCKVRQDHCETDDFGFCRGPLVLTNLLTWSLNEEEKRNSFTNGRSGDASDMTFYGFFQRDDGSIYDECDWTYMDLEFVRSPLTGARRILKALSSFIKGDIGIELFMNAYNTFVTEKYLEDRMSRNGWYTEDGLRLAGLLEEP